MLGHVDVFCRQRDRQHSRNETECDPGQPSDTAPSLHGTNLVLWRRKAQWVSTRTSAGLGLTPQARCGAKAPSQPCLFITVSLRHPERDFDYTQKQEGLAAGNSPWEYSALEAGRRVPRHSTTRGHRRLSVHQHLHQLFLQLVESLAIRFPFLLQDSGEFRRCFYTQLQMLLHLQINHFFQQIHKIFCAHAPTQSRMRAERLLF